MSTQLNSQCARRWLPAKKRTGNLGEFEKQRVELSDPEVDVQKSKPESNEEPRGFVDYE
jgi:hypothetical protein